MTTTETREQTDRLDVLLARPEVREAMRARCESQAHEWVNCMTVMFAVYQWCEWCGEER